MLDAWLEARVPAPPPALARRIRDVIHATPVREGTPLPEVLLAAGQRLLQELLTGDDTTRNGAIDLLTADALVTYAFEASSSEPDLIPERARAAMLDLAALAAAPHR